MRLSPQAFYALPAKALADGRSPARAHLGVTGQFAKNCTLRGPRLCKTSLEWSRFPISQAAIGARVVVAGRDDAFPIQESSGPARLGFDKPKDRFTRGELQKRSLACNFLRTGNGPLLRSSPTHSTMMSQRMFPPVGLTRRRTTKGEFRSRPPGSFQSRFNCNRHRGRLHQAIYFVEGVSFCGPRASAQSRRDRKTARLVRVHVGAV
jgi:hypothetical protein